MRIAVALAVLCFAAQASAAPRHGFRLVAGGLPAPVYVTAAPGEPGSLYVVGQRGTVDVVRKGKVVRRFLDLSAKVSSDGERGLLSIAFHPRYASNHLFYVDYTDKGGDTNVVELSSADPAHERQLLFVHQPWPNHNGGQLQVDRAGRLYVGMGDGGTDPNVSHGDPTYEAQNPASRLGKLLRVDPLAGADWQLVGLGLRNPWRFSFDRRTGDLWIGDVGTNLYEEIDFRPAAAVGTVANYGWSRFEGTIVYNDAAPLSTVGARVSPRYEYRSGFDNRCGVIGGYVYRGKLVPSLAGRYVFGDLCTGQVFSIRRDGRGFATMPGTVRGLSSFGEDASGELYAVGLRGGLYQLR